MKNTLKFLSVGLITILFASFVFVGHAEAQGRYGSFRVGGYTSHGKGSHYIGGYVRSVPFHYR